MSSPIGLALLRRAAGTSAAATAVPARKAGELRDYQPGPRWMRMAPPAVTIAVLLAGITVPSYWRDEAATLAAVRRPFGDMIAMLGNVDAVHGAYYALAWVVVRLFGSGELALRLPSVIAMAIAAAFVAALGRRLVSPQAGLAAGLLFAVVPDISLYGQDARPYAMVTAMATIATYLLVRALGTGHGHQRRWWIGYAISLALVGILNIFGLLLLAAHAVTVGLALLAPQAGQSRRALARRWILAVAAALLAASPLIILGWLQRGQISWLAVHGTDGVSSAVRLVGSPVMSYAVLGVVIAAAAVTVAAARRHPPGERVPAWLRRLLTLCVPWLVLPAAILFIASDIKPVYNFRYILFCVPAAALLGGAALAALGRIAGTAALILVAILSLNSQVAFRTPAGHGDDIRQADKIIAATSQRGDVILYTNRNAETFSAAYPYGLSQLRDIRLAQGPISSATLGGTNVSLARLRSRLAGAKRLWIVEINDSAPAGAILHDLHYHLIWIWQSSDIWLRLYERMPRGTLSSAGP
ncbi:MAG: glycosyltransferase family 39 protein [Streptosporangiaceae bacterium]